MEEDNKSVCKVIVATGKECGSKFAGKFPTNLRKHLEKNHTEEYKTVEKKEEKKKQQGEKAKKAQSPKSPTSIESNLLGARPCDKDSVRYQSISRKLAIFIGASNVPNSLVSNTDFRDFVEELNPKYDIPDRAAMSKALDLLLMEMKGKISAGLNDSGKIALTINLWSKKGMSESFLRVTGLFFLVSKCRQQRE